MGGFRLLWSFVVVQALLPLACSGAGTRNADIDVPGQLDGATYELDAAAAPLSLEALSAGIDVISYQWYRGDRDSEDGGVLVSTASAYIPPTTSVGSFEYYAIVKRSKKGRISTLATNTATITVVPPLDSAAVPVITRQPVSNAYLSGADIELSVEAVSPDGGTLIFQWYSTAANNTVDGYLIPSARASSFKLKAAQPGVTYYYVVITNSNPRAPGKKTLQMVSATAKIAVESASEPRQAGLYRGASPSPALVFNESSRVRTQIESALTWLEDAVLVMKSGAMIRGRETGSGGTVCLGQGRFTMDGGVISGGDSAGSVHADRMSFFRMNGGSIIGNDRGPCVRLLYNVEFTMSGGTISSRIIGGPHDAVGNGGVGVYIAGGYNEFTMTGGLITGNKSLTFGGGVCILGGNNNFTIRGGSISGNSAETFGGGVYMGGSKNRFVMHGGSIADNHAGISGGGVCVDSNATLVFTKTGGVITGGDLENANRLGAPEVGHGAALNAGGDRVFENTIYKPLGAGVDGGWGD